MSIRERHNLKKQLRGLQAIAPSPRWLAARREVLLQQVRSQMKPMVKPVVPAWREQLLALQSAYSALVSAIAARSIAVATLAVVALFATSGYVVAAADKSIPGDALYPVKLSVENYRLRLARSPQDSVGLQIEFANRRLHELAALQGTDRDTLPQAELLVTDFETRMKSAAATSTEIAATSPEEGLEIARLFDGRVAEYQHSLEATGQATKTAGVSKRVNKALTAVNKASTEALKVIVTQDSKPTPEVTAKLDGKIKEAEAALKVADERLSTGGVKAKSDTNKKAKEQSVVAKTNLAEAKKKLTEGDFQAAIAILQSVEDLVTEVVNSADDEAEEAEKTDEPTGEVKGDEAPDSTEAPASESSSTSNDPAPAASSSIVSPLSKILNLGR